MSLVKTSEVAQFAGVFINATTLIGATGLTGGDAVTVNIYRVQIDGTVTAMVTAGATFEIGKGVYGYNLATGSTGTRGIYVAVFITASTAVVNKEVQGAQIVGQPWVETNDATVSSRLATSGYTAPLDAAGVRAAIGLASANIDTQLAAIAGYIDTEIASMVTSLATISGLIDTEVAAIKAKTDNLPSDPADQSAIEAAITAATSTLATAANLATVAGYLDTEIAAIKTQTDKLTFDGSNRISANVTAMAADVLTASALATDAVNEIKASLQALGVTVTSPVDSTGKIEIIKGATYDQDDGLAINITLTGAPSITSATPVVLKLYDCNTNELTTLTGSAASSAVARFELTAAESAALSGGQYRYYLFITLSGGNVIVPTNGYFEVDDPADA